MPVTPQPEIAKLAENLSIIFPQLPIVHLQDETLSFPTIRVAFPHADLFIEDGRKGLYLRNNDAYPTQGPFTYFQLVVALAKILAQGPIPDLEPPATPAESQKHILQAQEALNMPTDLAMTRAKTRLDQFLKYRDDIRADPPPDFSHIDHKIDHFLLGLRYLAFEKRVTAFMERIDRQHLVPNDFDWAPPANSLKPEGS